MGQVFAAWDTAEERAVAVKALRTDREEERRQRAELRFRREFHSLASLAHPRIIEVYDYGVDPDRGPFYTMELLDGHDLKERIGKASIPETCRLLRDVAAALALLHIRGMVHRDLAPKNVRCTEDGHAKLIDFGVLANVGASGEIAGTLPYIAPESLRGMPLDGRTDLYSLGALAYHLLTGTVPYSVRSLDDFEHAWQRTVVPPSHVVDDVPPAMDELILSLLCLDPMGRPASAAEVIERLTGIGQLDVDPDIEVEQGFLASAAMVGRKHEMKVMRSCVKLAVRGSGNAAFIEAESGTGKSRLLREVALEAKVAGAVTAEVSCETAAGGPYDVIRNLMASLWESADADVKAAAEKDAPVLGHVFPEVLSRLPGMTLAEPATDPAEQRMRIQRAVADSILAIAERRSVALFIDDVQRCDEASAAVLASLTRECQRASLSLVIASRTNEEVRAKAAVAAMRRCRTNLFLTGLDRKEIEELVKSLFGDAKNARRLARFMRDVTGGSPLYCTELCRHLVDVGTIRYEDGLWILPASFDREDAPVGLAAAMDSRIAQLDASGRTLGEALAVVGGVIELERVVQLAEGTHDETFAALDDLTRHGVLVGSKDRYRFRHDGLREALLRGLSDERRRHLHLRVAEALESDADRVERAAAVGWHFYEAGEHERAVRYLDAAGRRLFEAQALSDCIAPLHTAVEIHRAQAAPRTRYMELLAMLLAAGWVSDREVGDAVASETVHVYHRYVGMKLAERLGRIVGRHLAFVVGLSVSFLGWIFALPGRRGPRPDRALIQFMVSLGYACGLANAANHVEQLQRYVRLAEVLDILHGRFPYAAYLGIKSFPDILLGHLGAGAKKLSRSVEIITTDRLTPATDFERRLAEAGMRGLRALIDVNQLNPRLHDDLARCAELGLRYYQLVAETTMVVHHRYRGEEALARALEEKLEAASLQLGSWSTDVQILLFAHPAYAVCRDVVGLKRSYRELERRVEEGMSFENRLALIQCELERERGDFDRAVDTGSRVVADCTEDNVLFRQWGLSAVAEAQLAAGRWAEAAESARRCLSIAEDPELEVVIPRLRCERILGMAEVGLGEVESGTRRLERLIRETEGFGAPSLAGLAHEARARVALNADDRPTYLHHANEANRWFRSTDNPCLIAIGERLVDAGAPRRQVERQELRALSTLADVRSQRTGSETSVQRPSTATSDSRDAETLAEESNSFDRTLSERPTRKRD